MRAAWYERQGAARDVLVVGEMPDPEPGPGEVRIRVAASGINPGDVKKRQDAFGYGMPYPRVIPHSDGAGTIDRVGDGVPASRVGERAWCYGAQSYRPFGTAAEYVVVPAGQAVPLPDGVPFEQGACLGIPGITAHRCVHAAGPVAGRVVLVQGGAGAVGLCAVQLARRAGARVIATVRSGEDEAVASRAGAHEVIRTGGVPAEEVVGRIRTLAPEGVAHIVEVAFDANIARRYRSPGGRRLARRLRDGGASAAGAVLGAAVQEHPGVLPGQRRLPGRGEGRRGPRAERRPGGGVAGVRGHPAIPLVGDRRSP